VSPVSAKISSARTDSGLTAYQGEWTSGQVAHLLKRTLFGSTKSDMDHFSKLTPEQAVDELLNDTFTEPSPPVNNYNVDGYTDPAGVLPGQTWVTSSYIDKTLFGKRILSFKSWWLGRMVNQQRSLREKMTLFWHNHFATEADKVKDARYCYYHNVLLRRQALGNFKELAKAVTLDPGMLRYLNGELNEKSAPDENYARELQELFTIGKGPDSHYTEADVKAAARVLTGYRVDNTNVTSYFDATKHDSSNKQFSDFYGRTIITGRTGDSGRQELDDMLDMIFAQQEAARFICRKLYRFFVYYEIDAAAEATVIEPLAAILRDNNYEIKPVLKALFISEHFYDPLNMGCLIKSPVDFTVGLCREFGVTFPPESDYEKAYGAWAVVVVAAAGMQQNIGDPPGVSGWPAYYQEPQYHELWINSDTLPKRNRSTDALISAGLQREGYKIVIDPIAFAAQLPKPEDPNSLISDSLSVLYRLTVSQQTKDFLKTQVLLSGQSNDYYWTAAWTGYQSNPSDTANKTILLTRLQAFYKYLMDLSEYQLS
jgi:uncharacterized protein (DUF1800 family)